MREGFGAIAWGLGAAAAVAISLLIQVAGLHALLGPGSTNLAAVVVVVGAAALLGPFAVFAARRWIRIEPFPYLRWLFGTNIPPRRPWLAPAFAAGLAVGGSLWSLSIAHWLGVPIDESVLRDGFAFLAVDAAAINEEVLFRLCLLFPLASLLWARAYGDRRFSWQAWAAIVFVGLAFGAVHVLNGGSGSLRQQLYFALLNQGVVGIALGAVAWRWGIETSILAHYFANVMEFDLFYALR